MAADGPDDLSKQVTSPRGKDFLLSLSWISVPHVFTCLGVHEPFFYFPSAVPKAGEQNFERKEQVEEKEGGERLLRLFLSTLFVTRQMMDLTLNKILRENCFFEGNDCCWTCPTHNGKTDRKVLLPATCENNDEAREI